MFDLTTTISQLDRLHLCGAYKTAFRPAMLAAADGDTERAFSIAQILELDAETLHVGDYLTALVRISRDNPELRFRLTGFFNDLAIHRLADFEAVWPNETLPRRAIEATREMMDGKLTVREWYPFVHAANRAWAVYFAPEPFVTDAEWASLEFRSWSGIAPEFKSQERLWDDRVLESAWLVWAAFVVKTFFFLRKDQQELNSTALESLLCWLQSNQPTPFPLPPPRERYTFAHPGGCGAEEIGDFEMVWSSLISFPNGLRRLRGVTLSRNSSLCVPDGVEEIGRLTLIEHPDTVLPDSLKVIDDLDVGWRSSVNLPEGLQRIGKMRVAYDSDGEVKLPLSTRVIDFFDAECEVYWDGLEEEQEGDMEAYERAIDDLEAMGSTQEDRQEIAHALLPGGRQLIRKRRGLTFAPSDGALTYQGELVTT